MQNKPAGGAPSGAEFDACRSAFVAMLRAENNLRSKHMQISTRAHWSGIKAGFAADGVQARWNDFRAGWLASNVRAKGQP